MKEVDLKKLNRAELLTMLMSVTQRCDDLEEELEWANEELANRDLIVGESGTMAEAALRLNGVFESADQATEQYLENIQRQYREQDAIAREMMEDTKARCLEIETETRERCATMISAAKEESQAYWDEVYERLEQYCQAVEPLKELFARFAS